MKESEKRYKKERQKHVAVNLTMSDFERWSAYASLRSLPMATMIRSLVNSAIDEIEDDYKDSISDILEMQERLKEDTKL